MSRSIFCGRLIAALLLASPGAMATQLRQGPPRPAAAPGRPIESISEYREGHHVPVVSSADWVRIPLDGVDLSADPVLSVDGRAITQNDLRRSLCLLLGSNEIDQFLTYALVTQLCTRWGVTVDVDEAEVARQFEQQKQLLAQTGQRDPAEWEKQIKEVFGWERYVEFQKVQLGFEKLFLPDPPAGFLEAQAKKFQELLPAWEVEQSKWKAALAEAQQKARAEGLDPEKVELPPPPQPLPEADLSFLRKEALELVPEDYRSMVSESYARGQELHPYLRLGMVADLKRQLVQNAKVEFEPARLGENAAEVLFTVDGHPVKIDEVYSLIESRVQDSGRRLALRELVHLTAADIALEKAGALASLDELDQWFEELRAKYSGTFIPLPNIIFLRGFPNEYHYKRYWRRRISFQKLLERTVTEEQLKEHYEKAGRLFFEKGTASGSVLFLPADGAGGLDGARAKLDDALAGIASGTAFADIARSVGQYPATPGVDNGHFTGLVRNRLRQVLHESEYSTFAMGYSLADEVFYLAAEGELVGPIETDFSDNLRGLIVVSPDRFETAGPLQDFATVRDSVLEDLGDLRFARFVNEALTFCRIEAPAKRP